MNMMAMLLAALALIPQPRELKETAGTCPVGTKIEYVQDSSIQKEGYRLSVTPNTIRIASADAAGRFYAEQTLEQLKNGKVYACAEINDWPEYVWRGVLVDEGRHFLGRETVKHIIDTIAHHKLNVLHWHLTEDQGWRIDVPGLPELAKYGSVRPSSAKYGADLKWTGSAATGHCSEQNGDQYGPFYYTEAELRDVVAYAESKHVTIVPEIDMPGHMRGAIAAYPDFTCFPEHITNRMAHTEWGVITDVLCMGNDDVLPFVKKVLDFVCDVFPSKVIHIGGDECPRLNWEKCPKCQARMKAEGLKEPGGLQTWFTRQVVAYLETKGRRADGWDEYLNGDVPKSAIGQSWRTQSSNGAELMKRTVALERGHDIVVSPHTECYYNYHQDVEDDPYQYIGLHLPLKQAYDFDPMTGLPESARKQVLGSEACVWGEWVWNRYDFDWKLWPRGCAMAEILWTNPKVRDYDGLIRRLAIHRKRLVRQYVNCAPVSLCADCKGKRSAQEVSAFRVDFSSTNQIAEVYNYRDRTPMSVKKTDRGAALVFTGVKNVRPGEEWGADTQWGLGTRKFDVKSNAEYCVVLRMAGNLPAGYGKVVSEVQWFGRDGKALQTVDQLGRDIPLTSPVKFPTAVRGTAPETVVYSRGVVPPAAVAGRVVFKVDMPDLKPGEKVEVHECAYYEHQKGTSWQFDDVDAPVLELLNEGHLKCDTEPLRFRLKDATGVDMTTFECSVNGAAVALADLKRDGEAFVYEPKTPWTKDSVQMIEVTAADKNGVRGRDCVFAVFTEGQPTHSFGAIRDDGVMLVDGKPFFPFGLFGVRPHDGNNHDLAGCVREMSENGLNVAQTYMIRGQNGSKQDAHYDTLVEACGQHGMLFYSEPALRSLEPRERFRRMAENLFRGRHYKGILAWGVGDDTSVNTSPDELKRLHRFCKAIDPGAMTISADIVKSPSHQADYIPNADILLLESYPIRAEKPQPDEMAKAAEVLDDAWAAVGIAGVKGHSVMALPQCFKGWKSWKRYPTKEEIRAQTYIAICCRARGLIYYTSCGFNGNEGPLNDPVHKREFYEFSREIAALMPSLVTRDAARQPKVSVVKGKAKNVLGGDAVRTLLKEDGLLVVANTSQLPVTAEITLPDGRRLVRELSDYGAFAEKTAAR